MSKKSDEILQEYNDLKIKLAEIKGYRKAIEDVIVQGLLDNKFLEDAIIRHDDEMIEVAGKMNTMEVTYPEYLI